MSSRNVFNMLEVIQGMRGAQAQLSRQPLDYGCSQWILCSQRASNLYRVGVKLWKKEELEKIERELAQSSKVTRFTVHLIDGRIVHIRNPMYGEPRPIWQPYVEFRDYWRLVKEEPNKSPGIYLCSYLVNWNNLVARDYEKRIEFAAWLFDDMGHTWNNSETCKFFKSLVCKLLKTMKVTKVICFGLGDITRNPPVWWTKQNFQEVQEADSAIVETRAVQHSMALTLAETISQETGRDVRCMAQDPDYTDETKKILRENGFEIVGQFGAGGFAEVDDESAVISIFPNAPVKQIIADIAQPVLFIRAAGDEAFNENGKPYIDAESPRTEQMWRQYECLDIPTLTDEARLKVELDKLKVYTRVSEVHGSAESLYM
ncbi:uncharacterized protein F4822DRAFT_443507 [Hypoxylon trugodes]|uniref:uncharacterized protein n=1 Tax=Hypoxylon trugodes TaxID=326681 RepID=UPI00219BD125|nr:uncharacterized protein F4822DRAFT_443507 [Hypoxylon trugodes]KAI1388627.1 hypothetical protein F4822DRAFT_443507 [Hypoxylon trugodes]